MSIKIECGCGHEWTVRDTLAGKAILCPRCAEEITIPHPGGLGPAAEPYSPSSLSRVSAVEVLALAQVDAPDLTNYLRDRAKTPGVRIEGETAGRIADLWRNLAPGVLSVTHMPVFGLRFLDGDRVICQASLCWIGTCIRGESTGRSFEYGFELDETAVALYEELKRVTGNS